VSAPAELPPRPGQSNLVSAGLAIGILLLGIQLWLLTVALDLYLGGRGDQVWSLALVSGVIFVGGIAVLWILRRRPRMAPSTRQAAGVVPPRELRR
jgi:hypothetical protein